jgi:hypothetical protein
MNAQQSPRPAAPTLADKHEARRRQQNPLTENQAMALHFVGAHIMKLGYAPLLQQIADWLDVGKCSAFEIVDAVVTKGYLIKETDRSRGLQLTAAGAEWIARRDFMPNITITLGEIILNRRVNV